MVKLKRMRLKNYCGFRDSTIDFTDGKKIKQMVCFCGRNGCGKSTSIYAADMLGGSYRFEGRENDQLFRKITYSQDYDPALSAMMKIKQNMKLEGVFDDDGKERRVVIDSGGVVINELPMKQSYPREYVYKIDADNMVNLHKFSIHAGYEKTFLALANEVYGFKVTLGNKMNDLSVSSESFYTDVIIHKKIRGSITKVHFRRMSDGERKIAKLCESLCNPIWMKNIDIVGLDNMEMHIYYERHARMISKILELFPDKQFIVTTHSAVLAGMKDDKLGIDIKPFLPAKYLYNVENM